MPRLLAFLLALTTALTAGAAERLAGPLVDAAWLADNLAREGLVVLDVRSEIGAKPGDFERAHIPGSVHADYQKAGWRTRVANVPGMLPTPQAIETLVGGLGIGNDDHVVIVSAGTSALSFGSATRVYWTFKVMGHDAVSILDGGFAGWQRAGLPVENGPSTPAPKIFAASFRPELLATRADVEAAMAPASGVTLVDNRPPQQYLGDVKRQPGMRVGHVPGALNIPQSRFRNDATGRFASKSVLGDLWKEVGADGSDAQIAYCNSGHWASLGWFTASELLGKNSKLYDGSMIEWSRDKSLPMTTEPTAKP